MYNELCTDKSMPACMNMSMKLTTPLDLIDDRKTASYFKRDNVKSE